MTVLFAACALLVLVSFFASSCGGAPAPAAPPEPVPEPPVIVDEPEPVPEPPPPPPPLEEAVKEVYAKYVDGLILEGATNHIVIRGDTLSRIALASYGRGNGYFFPIIMMASRDQVKNPDLIEPGMDLVIPDLQKNLDDPETRAHIKAFLNDLIRVYGNSNSPYAATMYRNLTDLANSL